MKKVLVLSAIACCMAVAGANAHVLVTPLPVQTNTTTENPVNTSLPKNTQAESGANEANNETSSQSGTLQPPVVHAPTSHITPQPRSMGRSTAATNTSAPTTTSTGSNTSTNPTNPLLGLHGAALIYQAAKYRPVVEVPYQQQKSFTIRDTLATEDPQLTNAFKNIHMTILHNKLAADFPSTITPDHSSTHIHVADTTEPGEYLVPYHMCTPGGLFHSTYITYPLAYILDE